MVIYKNRSLYNAVHFDKFEPTDLIFSCGVLATITIQFVDQNLFSFDVIGLFAFCLLVGIPLYLLTSILFPDFNFELQVAAIISLFVLYILLIGLTLVLLSYIFNNEFLYGFPSTLALILGSVALYTYSRSKSSTQNSISHRMDINRLYKIIVIGASFITITVVFAWHLNFNQTLVQIGILYSFVILLAIIGSSKNLGKIECAIIIFIISIALVFHNELAQPILGAGDSDKEFYVSNIVLAQENWPVDISQSKFSAITIVVFHPIMTILTPLSLEGMYRLVYPLLFSTVPSILYFVYRSSFNRQVSYWGALLIVFLYPFYTVFALNTRTGYVLLFVSLLLLFYFNTQTVSLAQRGLRIGLLFLISTTYYATGPIFIVVLGVAKVAQIVDGYIGDKPTNLASKIPTLDLAILGVGTTAWLIYTTDSYTFDLVAGVLIGTIRSASESLFNVSSSSGGSAFTQEFSYTFQLVSYIYVLLTILILISLVLLTYLRYIRPADRQFSGAYYPIFVGGGLIFVAAFLPTSSVGIARLYTIGLIFLAPASFFAIYYTSEKLEVRLSWIIPILMTFILIINTGFVGIALGDDRITQQHLINDNSGGVHNYHSSEWVIDFREPLTTIYGSGDSDRLKGEFFVTEYESGVPGGYAALQSENQTGLIYLSSRSVADETIIPKLWYRGGLATEREFIGYDQLALEETNLVYSTGNSQVRYRG